MLKRRGAALAAVLIASATACSSGFTTGARHPAAATSTPSRTATAHPTSTSIAAHPAGSLQALAAPSGLLIGTAVDRKALTTEEPYRTTLAEDFGIVTPENAMKWGPIQPGRHRFDFAPADQIVAFAQAHGQQVHGHNLAWYQQNPDWLTHGTFTRDQLIQILHDHISTVVGHFKGRVALWDVVNEAIESDGSLRPNVWSNGIGPDYIELAFTWAHQADPTAKLYYNDFGLEFGGPKADAVYDLVRGLKAKDVPIDGVGFQTHLINRVSPPAAKFEPILQRFAGLGVDVAITEFDDAIKLTDDRASAADLEQQAVTYRGYLGVCLAVVRCRSFTMWGFTDKHSWIPGFLPGFGAALPFDDNYRPKPADRALVAELRTAVPTAPKR